MIYVHYKRMVSGNMCRVAGMLKGKGICYECHTAVCCCVCVAHYIEEDVVEKGQYLR